jgi:hypothetical protein
MHSLVFGLLFMSAASALAAETYETPDVVVESSKLELKSSPSRVIRVDGETAPARPSLDAALTRQPEIQVAPTPLRNTNLTLDGMDGEHVAVWWDGDPVIGRIDGALDARTVPLGNTQTISVYHGLDSLPYGSQNIAGAISLDAPWDVSQGVTSKPTVDLKSAAGSLSRTVLSGRADVPEGDTGIRASVANWRGDAVRASGGDAADTLMDSTARFSAALLATHKDAVRLGGADVDVRAGGDGFAQNGKGVFGGIPTEGDQRRVHVFADARRKDSLFHVSYSEYRNDYTSDHTDSFRERAVRAGPQLQEQLGRWTLLAGSQADLRDASGTRIAADHVTYTSVGSHLGARYALSEHWVAGAGTRWDTGPGLVSPRGELRYLFDTGAFDESIGIESGLGFRDITAKERYLDFTNPSLHYRVLGNPALLPERAWMTALRHEASDRHWKFSTAIFQVRLSDAIGFLPAAGQVPGSSDTVLTYTNMGQTLSHGVATGAEYKFAGDKLSGWTASLNYQWLNGRNLTNGGALFLQPEHRVILGARREAARGFFLDARLAWTSRQAFFDSNHNGVADDDWVAPYWDAGAEAGYGFRLGGVSNLVRVFGRVDNAFGVFREDTFPVEPRTFLAGMAVQL